jgi:hypothetical protein
MVVYTLIALRFYIQMLKSNNKVFIVTPVLLAVLYDITIALLLLILMINRASEVNLGFTRDAQQLALIRQTLRFVALHFNQVLYSQQDEKLLDQ